MKRRFHSLALAIAMGTTTLLASPVAPLIPSALAADPITGTVTTLPATDINKKGATLSGTYSGDMTAVTEAGIMFGGKATQMLVGYKVAPNGSTITKVIANWPDKATYYYQAYVVVGGKKIVGNVVSVTTGDPVITNKVLTGEVTAITDMSATINGSYADMGYPVTEVGVRYKAVDDTLWQGRSKAANNPFSFATDVKLKENTTYEYCVYAKVNGQILYGETKTFKTLAEEEMIPVGKVNTSEEIEFIGHRAILGGSYSDFELPVLEVGIAYGRSPNSMGHQAAVYNDSFSLQTLPLTEDTTYYYRAWAKVDNGRVLYGDTKSFVSPPKQAPGTYVTPFPANNITETSATLGTCIDNLKGTINSIGFEYSSNDDFSNSTVYTHSSQTELFSKTIDGLKPGTTYYVRSFAIIGGVTMYGTYNIEFTTAESLPQGAVKTFAASDVTSDSAKLSGYQTDFSILVTEVGFEYGKQPDGFFPDYAVGKMGSSFSASIRDLDDNTCYYFRAYAVVDGMRIFGPVESFTTSAVAPKIKAAVSVTTGALVKSAKGGTISGSFANIENATEIGFEYSQNADMSNAVKDDVALGGDFSASVSKAMLHFVFYYRAYVVADGQTYYGTINMAK